MIIFLRPGGAVSMAPGDSICMYCDNVILERPELPEAPGLKRSTILFYSRAQNEGVEVLKFILGRLSDRDPTTPELIFDLRDSSPILGLIRHRLGDGKVGS